MKLDQVIIYVSDVMLASLFEQASTQVSSIFGSMWQGTLGIPADKYWRKFGPHLWGEPEVKLHVWHVHYAGYWTYRKQSLFIQTRICIYKKMTTWTTVFRLLKIANCLLALFIAPEKRGHGYMAWICVSVVWLKVQCYPKITLYGPDSFLVVLARRLLYMSAAIWSFSTQSHIDILT